MNKATEHGPYTYNYDSLYRLAGAVSPVLPRESFSYDPVGNTLTSASATNWTYNANNELEIYNGVSFQYDLNGNTAQKSDNGTIQNFLYNEDDRLTEVKDGTGSVIATYYYDPFGRRLWKEVGGARTHFIYADEGLIAEFDATGSQTKSYGYVPNSTWTTNPLFMKQDAEYYFYHNDHLGTPQKITSMSGAVLWSAKYESFGKALVDPASTAVNNLRFPGQYNDHETGLHYNFHRFYDPNTGRYLTSDPIGLAGGMNVSLYVDGNPTCNADPLGLRRTGVRSALPVRTQPQRPREVPEPPPDLVPRDPANPDKRVPGASKPEKGTVIPFVGQTYIHLWNYTFQHWFIDGVNDLESQMRMLTFPISLKIDCEQTRTFDICFTVTDGGVDLNFVKVPHHTSIYSEGVQCVSIDIKGLRGCRCIEDLINQPREEGLFWRQGK